MTETKDHYVTTQDSDSETEEFPTHDKSKLLNPDNVRIRQTGYTGNKKTGCRCGARCVVITISVVLATVSIFGAGYFAGYFTTDSVRKYITSKGWVRHKRTEPWRTRISDYGTESCVRLVDVDGDGLDDVIIGLALGKGVSEMVTKATMVEFCRKNGMDAPCAGAVMALRGTDGKVLWKTNVYSEIFAFNCHGVDVNKDGRYECIATGRLGTIIAMDTRHGKILWEGSDNNYRRDWNIYSSATVQDLDFDGVREIVIAHGGDPTVPAEIHTRKSNRIVLVSGATGVPIGRPIITPEDKESYISPVIHTRRDGSQYVLYGSGGETVGGLFLVISLPDFYRYALGYDKNYVVSNVKGKYDKFGFKEPDGNGVIELFRSEVKGVMVPPVLADVNNDGVKDILMSCFDGTMILYDGETLNIMWKRDLGEMESYSSPAPGHFNDDNVLDFMVHWSVGAWPTYNATNTIVMDGRDGTILWNLTSNRYDVTSDLTIQTDATDLDLFLFRVQGRYGRDPFPVGAIHGATGVQRLITKRSTEDEIFDADDVEDVEDTVIVPESYFRRKREASRKGFVECEMDHRVFLTEMFVLGRHNMKAPTKVWEKSAEKYYYRLSEADRKLVEKIKEKYSNKTMKAGDMPWKGKRDVQGPLCVISEPDERTTGAIGDVDGDGKLDAIVNMVSVGVLRDEDTNFVKMKFDVDIYKVNIEEIMPRAPRVPVNFNVTIHQSMRGKEYHLPSGLKFRPANRQTWGGYMGTYGDSIYS